MSHIVAFEIENECLSVAVAQTSGRRIKIEKTFLFDLAADDSNTETGERLRKLLSTQRVSRADAIAVISRSNAEIRELTLPPAPDRELADLVKFKARSDFGSFNDNWSLDFVPFEGDTDKPRTVLAAAISPELMAQISEVSESAGLRLKHIVFRPYAAVDLLRTRLSDEQCRIIVDESGDQVDVTLTQGSKLVATRTVRIPIDSAEKKAAQLLREIRRTVASRVSRLDAQTPQEILVCGGDPAEAELLETMFTGELEIETHYVDPFQLVNTESDFERPDKSQSFTALLGALVQHAADQAHEIDFLNPRKSFSDKTDLRQFYRMGGIVAAALMLIGLLGWWMLHTQANEIEDLTRQIESQNQKNNGASPEENVSQILEEIKPLDAFKQSSINWLDEMFEISRAAKTPDEFIVDAFDISVKNDVPTIVLAGRVKDPETEISIRRDLINRPYPIVRPNKAGKSGDPNYPEKFSYTIKMSVPAASQVNAETNRLAIEYLRSTAAPAPLPSLKPTDPKPSDSDEPSNQPPS